jgi:hypothetical protein
MTKTNPSAKPADASTSAPFDAVSDINGSLSSEEDVQTHSSDSSASNDADKPENDDTCCGDACTSKTCKRALKALEFDLSDHSPHGHSSHGH